MQMRRRLLPLYWVFILFVSGCTVHTATNATSTAVKALPRPVGPASLPNLQAAMANYDYANKPPLWIACFGPSTRQGATLADATANAPCQHFV